MSIDIWMGVECTVNRVGDCYFDQISRTGHDVREGDLDRFASLGIKTIRYPILWERTMPDDQPNWDWPDRQLRRLRELNIRPVVGLIHHGSGPRHTSLLDPDFPEKLSAYARAFAERYPWVEDYIPVNEPLTTARFSGLYGHWYPHAHDDLSFCLALLHQSRASILAMNEIRRVNPSARFLQSEDLGKTFSSRRLRYQADFDNQRRWLSFDLLCARVNCRHPMWPYFRGAGISQRELSWFLDHPCPPDVMGINHYLTSDRYLDERLEDFPPSSHGSNGRDSFADFEAVRVQLDEEPDEELGPEARLAEAWERYRLPIVVTEAHLGCDDVNESLRWLWHVYQAAENQRRLGVDVQAVTAWAALGAYDWNCLVTRDANCYEAGLFDVTDGVPRPTALAELVRDLAAGTPPSHQALQNPGWWARPERFTHLRPVRAA
jgi:dTDP-4-dehydrorhamnose reductase